MKEFKHILPFLVSCVFSINTFAAGDTSSGAGSSGGADYIIDVASSGGAWFLGTDKTVSYCIEKDTGFGVDSKEVNEAVTTALNKWRDYILTSGDYYYQKRTLSHTFLQTSCSEQTDLIFYFGSKRPAIERAKKNFNRPVAMAVQTNLDYISGWTKGFVWLAPALSIDKGFPNWNHKIELSAILLHEVGHVFGADHVPGTIMQADIARTISQRYAENQENDAYSIAYNNLLDRLLLQIDQQRRVLFGTFHFNFKGNLGNKPFAYEASSIHDGTKNEKEIFELLVGRSPKGKISARLFGEREENLKIEIKDDSSTEVFESKNIGGYPIRVTQPNKGMYIYRAPKVSDPSDYQTISSSDETIVSYGEMTSKNGTKIRLLFEMNNTDFDFNEGPIQVKYLGPNGIDMLFRSSVLQ